MACKVKWALGSITMNKASGGDGIPVELFQIQKDDTVKVLQSICQQIWKTQQWSQDWKRLVFIPIPKKGNAKECSNYCTIALISLASKGILKILQARLQQYVNRELPDVQTMNFKMFWCWIIKKVRVPEKHLVLLYSLCQNLWLCGPQKMWKILQEVGIPGHLTCLLRNLFAGQEATVRTGHGTTEYFQIEKGVCQGCTLLSAFLTYMQKTSWETLGWMKHNLESSLPWEISITSDTQMTPPLWQKMKNN